MLRRRGRQGAGDASAASAAGIPAEFLPLERDTTDPWGPFDQVKVQLHPESQCWSLGMQPHFNFLNIRTLDVPAEVNFSLPRYFTGNFCVDASEQPIDELGDTAARLKRKSEWISSHVPGAKIFFPLRSTGMTYNMLAAYCAYSSPGSCAEWQHTDDTLLSFGIPRWGRKAVGAKVADRHQNYLPN